MDIKNLFDQFYKADTEETIDGILQNLSNSTGIGWAPYGENESFFGVIENQQAAPVPALIEKITNSIDAILMRRCLEEGINPKGSCAPRSVAEAVHQFFAQPQNWDLAPNRAKQAEFIQILARGPKGNTSLVIYDDGEGQHPEDFKDTFLSLLRGNKNEIPFVQGKYNMGGAGAVVFCGKKRYQLIASKRYDNKGRFGFTIMRKHPLTKEEEKIKKNTWYEYLLINGEIPAFDIDTLDLGLHKRRFSTGTIIKLYSYDLPIGARSVISRDLNQSINEFLFDPALPVYTIDTKERFPGDQNLERHLYGLKRRLEEDGSKYIRKFFSISSKTSIGSLKITVYVFNSRMDGKSAKETKEAIRREFFKNNMSVLFSLNGQVHGHLTSEFITRSLAFNLLKDYLLIHVDCTNLNNSFRSELFMGSRDRLKNGEEYKYLRGLVANELKRGELKDIYKEWKNSISTQSDSAEDLLKDFSEILPKNKDLMKLLSNTFKLDIKDADTKGQRERQQRPRSKKETPFNPNRFPSTFQINPKPKGDDLIPITKIPLGGTRTVSFSTDVEDQYFDRVEDPGKIEIVVLSSASNEDPNGTDPGIPKDPESLINVSISSPDRGKIRVNIKPNEDVSVGNTIKIKASLSAPEGELSQVFIVQISDKENKPIKTPESDDKTDNIGLPKLEQVFENRKECFRSWNDLNGVEMDYSRVMYPFVEGDKLDKIIINMDSTVLKNYKSKLRSEEQMNAANKRYISAVYFHTLFLYMICKNRKYQINKFANDDSNHPEEVDLSEYLQDIFDSYYSEFLLNFEMSTLIDSLED